MNDLMERAQPESWTWQVGQWECRITSAVGTKYIVIEAYPLYEGNAPDILLRTRHPLEGAEKFAALLKRYQQLWLEAGVGPTTTDLWEMEVSPWAGVVLAMTPDDFAQLAELIGRAVAHARKLVVVK